MEGWIAALVGSVLSALVGVWVGHQLREGSARKEWKRAHLREQAGEVRRWVRFCVTAVDVFSWLEDIEPGDEREYQSWEEEARSSMVRAQEGVTYASLLFLFVDDNALLGLLEKMRVLLERYDLETVKQAVRTRRPPPWAEQVRKDTRELAKAVDSRLVEMMDEV